MALEGVDFGKGRTFDPLVNPRRARKPQGRGRDWTDAELQVLRDHFEDKGGTFCLVRLPERTLTGVYNTARKLGLKRKGIAEHQSYKEHHAAIDAALKEAWPTLQGRRAFGDLVRRLGFPRHIVGGRAQKLGLSLPHKKEPRWTPAEDALLKKVPLHDGRRAAEAFRAHGFQRTPTAIHVRAVRLGIATAFQGGMSCRAAARVLGIDSKSIATWIEDGWLKAGRRGSRRLSQQGGDPYTIDPADLRACVIEHIDRIDIRKVDKFAFVELLVGGSMVPSLDKSGDHF